jgi:flavodoxin/NAD-dependent dihydropyrimidine dehydrogenase PreA subunit
MKALIIYYSQTGNTRTIAHGVGRGASGRADTCDVVPVKGLDPRSLGAYDLIGLGTPVWNGGEPPNVRKFLNGLPEQDGTHLFSFNTHGVMPELYFPSMVRKLRAKGFTVIGTRDWYGDCTIQTFPSPYFTGGHPDEIDLREAEEFGREMADRSRRVSLGETDLIPPVPDHVLTPQLLALVEFYRSGHNAHGRLTYDPEKCNYPKCHICVDNCVMEYIDLSATPRCYGSEGDACDMWMGCTFCESICPTGAISADWGAHFERMKPVFAGLGMGGEDLLAKVVDEAEAAGRFRRLVPKDEVGKDGPFFQAYPKHPRFRIPKDE